MTQIVFGTVWFLDRPLKRPQNNQQDKNDIRVKRCGCLGWGTGNRWCWILRKAGCGYLNIWCNATDEQVVQQGLLAHTLTATREIRVSVAWHSERVICKQISNSLVLAVGSLSVDHFVSDSASRTGGDRHANIPNKCHNSHHRHNLHLTIALHHCNPYATRNKCLALHEASFQFDEDEVKNVHGQFLRQRANVAVGPAQRKPLWWFTCHQKGSVHLRILGEPLNVK